jgi:predicted CoA-binding protein
VENRSLSTGNNVKFAEIENLTKEDVKEILTKYRTVAVVGASGDLSKDSHRVAEYLQDQGFHIIPVNPTTEEVFGEKCYKSLLEMPEGVQKTVEIADIFRPSAETPMIVAQAIKLKERYDKPYVVWMQLGIINEQAAETARQAGIVVVMNRCMMQEHRKLFPDSSS